MSEKKRRNANSPRFDFCIVTDEGDKCEVRTSDTYSSKNSAEKIRLLNFLIIALGFELPFTVEKVNISGK